MVNRSSLRGMYDLLATVALTALLAICIEFIPSNIPRIILGVPFIMFFPGYTLVAFMFPRKDSLGSIERLALSLILSLAIVPLAGLLLNYVWEISLYPVLITLAAFVTVMCVLAGLRRARLSAQERYQPQIHFQGSMWSQQSRLDRILAVVLAMALIGAVTTGIYVGLHPTFEERFTEFYLLGTKGTMEYYPQDIVLGAHADVTLGIVNHEGEQITYRVRISQDGADLQTIDGLVVMDGDTWEGTVTLTPTAAGDDQKVEFLLYRSGESEPCRSLHLWIDVRNPAVTK